MFMNSEGLLKKAQLGSAVLNNSIAPDHFFFFFTLSTPVHILTSKQDTTQNNQDECQHFSFSDQKSAKARFSDVSKKIILWCGVCEK